MIRKILLTSVALGCATTAHAQFAYETAEQDVVDAVAACLKERGLSIDSSTPICPAKTTRVLATITTYGARSPEAAGVILDLDAGAIARALAVNPKFILLDEPFAGIDPIAVEDIQRIVAKLKDKNIGILITDHNVQETLSITDRAYLLFEGKILMAGTAEELAADETVRRVYLGKNFELRKKAVFTNDEEL